MILQTRKRTPIALILYIFNYLSSLSLRRASHVLEPIINRSHVAIWKWIQKYSFVLGSDVYKHDVNSIFIDETEINVGGKLWVAYEPQLKAFLSFHISWHQNSLDAFS